MLFDFIPGYKMYLPDGEIPTHKPDEKAAKKILKEIKTPVQIMGEYGGNSPSYISFIGVPQNSESVKEYLAYKHIVNFVSTLPQDVFAVETFHEVRDIIRIYKFGLQEFWGGNVEFYGYLFIPIMSPP